MAGKHSAKRVRRVSRAPHIAGSLAVLATGAAVTAGVLGTQAPSNLLAADGAPTASLGDAARDSVLSRGGGDRETAVVEEKAEAKPELSPVDRAVTAQAVRAAIREADTQLWTTTELNLWTRPDKQADKLGVLPAGEKVLITGRRMEGRVEIVLEGESRWVTEGYLSEEKPFALGDDCTNGTTVPAAVSENIKKVHAAVCAAFPEITTYGTFRSDGEHAQGIAVDIMVSGDRGYQVAEFIQKYYAELGVNYIIYSQRIWSVDRSGEGWRAMEDRGSVTANHYDHVHVTTY